MSELLGVVIDGPSEGQRSVVLVDSMRKLPLPLDVYGADETSGWDVVEVEVDDSGVIELVVPIGEKATTSDRLVIDDAKSGRLEISFDAEDGTTLASVPLEPEDRYRADGLLASLQGTGTAYVRLPGDGGGFLWPEPQDLTALVDKHRKQIDEELGTAERNAVREKLDTHFVNPYTFVPLPESTDSAEVCPRCTPQGHDCWGTNNLSGKIDVRWRTLSPLMVRAAERTDVDDATPIGTMVKRGESFVIPGSSVKGAMRSLHEALAGGCLRVIDADHVPVHRDHPSPTRRKDWRLGLVRDVDGDGRPTKVQICEEQTMMAPATALQAARLVSGQERDLESGQRFKIPHWKADSYDDHGRRILRQESRVDAVLDPVAPETLPDGDGETGQDSASAPLVEAGTWTILVAESNAARSRSPFRCATGQLTEECREVTNTAWDDYLEVVAGGRDCGPGEREEIDVEHERDGAIGQALSPGRRLARDQVIWVKPGDTDEIDEISLAMLWRSRGEHAVKDRLGTNKLLPCTDPEDLCRTCQIFGSADVSGTEDGAPQHSYRSHLRFSEATAAPGTELEEAVDLAPLGQPRPSSGQFYLKNTSTSSAQKREDRPTAQWGSSSDSPNKRMIRGRKFYWHGTPAAQENARSIPRHRRRPHHGQDVVSRADLVPAGTEFALRVTFENLTAEQLGGLLATIDPDRLFDDRRRPPGYDPKSQPLATRIGGGKPFGFGSVQPIDVQVAVETGSSRYLGQETQTPTLSECIAEFVDTTPSPVRQRWRDLGAVLSPGHVPPENIWYPPTGSWRSVADGEVRQQFDWSFGLFSQRNGVYAAQGDTSLVVLADPKEVDQMLPIVNEPTSES